MQDSFCFRISNRFCVRSSELRFHVGGGPDNRHVANQRYSRHPRERFPISRDVAEYLRADTRDESLGCYPWGILYNVALNSEG